MGNNVGTGPKNGVVLRVTVGVIVGVDVGVKLGVLVNVSVGVELGVAVIVGVDDMVGVCEGLRVSVGLRVAFELDVLIGFGEAMLVVGVESKMSSAGGCAAPAASRQALRSKPMLRARKMTAYSVFILDILRAGWLNCTPLTKKTDKMIRFV